MHRCSWTGNNELLISYHDEEWGKPVYDDQKLFEMLCLEGAQAGLSWLTVLQKRESYRKLFYNFDATLIVAMTDKELDELCTNASIIRNRLKIYAFRKNAIAYLTLKQEMSVSEYLWGFVNHTALHSVYATRNENSDAMSQDLKKRGFTFVGSTICYAFMQAVGMINDHDADCFVRKSVRKEDKKHFT